MFCGGRVQHGRCSYARSSTGWECDQCGLASGQGEEIQSEEEETEPYGTEGPETTGAIETYDKPYEAEEIVGEKIEGGVVYYKVKWKGYTRKECTWEPREHMEDEEGVNDAFGRYLQEKEEHENVVRHGDTSETRRDGKRQRKNRTKVTARKTTGQAAQRKTVCTGGGGGGRLGGGGEGGGGKGSGGEGGGGEGGGGEGGDGEAVTVRAAAAAVAAARVMAGWAAARAAVAKVAGRLLGGFTLPAGGGLGRGRWRRPSEGGGEIGGGEALLSH